MQTAIRRERKPHETNILGYEPKRSTAGVTATLRQVLSKAAEWGVEAFVASAEWRVLLTVSNTMMLKGFVAKRCSSRICRLFCANTVISRVEFIFLARQCSLLSCMIVVLGREAWKAPTCGIRYWTRHSENLLVAGKRRSGLHACQRLP